MKYKEDRKRAQKEEERLNTQQTLIQESNLENLTEQANSEKKESESE